MWVFSTLIWLLACTSPCATCSESATRCTSCAAGYQIADTTCEQIVVAESSSESGLPGNLCFDEKY